MNTMGLKCAHNNYYSYDEVDRVSQSHRPLCRARVIFCWRDAPLVGLRGLSTSAAATVTPL